MKKLLVIEDDDFAYEIIKLQLEEIGYLNEQIIRCIQLSEIANINAEEIKVILTDLTLPDSTCKTTFKRVKENFPFKPIIVLTGSVEMEVAINAIQQGAQDYLVKGEFNYKMLEKAMHYAIERNRILDTIIIEKQNLRAMINNTKDIIWSVNRNYRVILANNAFWQRIYKITGKKKDEVTSSDIDKQLVNTWNGYFQKALNGELKKMVWSETHDGNKIYEEIRFNLIRDKDKNIIGVNCFSRDISKEYGYLKMIRKQNEQLRQIAWIQSHEVRGPVATILGLVNMFNVKNPSDAENIELMENIKLVTNKLDDVIRKINEQTSTT